MTFAAILADLYRRLRYTSAPPSAIATRLRAFCNETHREILTAPGMERLRDDLMPITATANKSRTGLPASVARVHAIVDRTNNHKLRQVPLSELRTMDPAQLFVGGFPLQYAVVGYQEVQIQPAVASGLWAVSSSASDTVATVFCESMTTGGYRHVTAPTGTTLTGTTRVQLGTRTDSFEVNKFYLSTACVGYVSLYDAVSGGTELARIEPGQLSQHYLAVEWFPIQTADITEYLDFTRTIFDLVNDTDEPLLPSDFHYLLPLGARMKEYEFLDDTRYPATQSKFLQGQAALKSFVLNDGDRVATLRRTPTSWSQLGSQFPAGS